MRLTPRQSVAISIVTVRVPLLRLVADVLYSILYNELTTNRSEGSLGLSRHVGGFTLHGPVALMHRLTHPGVEIFVVFSDHLPVHLTPPTIPG